MSGTFKDYVTKELNGLNHEQDQYWSYSRKEQEDILLYTEKSSIYETPTKEKFHEGADVLVRWTDGLLYLGSIIQVEDEFSRCAVKFEDGSQYWALYKDIYKGPPPNNEIMCTVCDTDSSDPPDEIVICDKCSVGYHQLCHVPKIDSSLLRPEISWACRKCIFIATAKKGGAIKKGTKAQTMLLMKQTLPYDIQALTWDSSHKSNLQQTYCYCGGPGEWFMKMMQCLKCKQWFHEACLQCLDESLLYGDRFYIFVCSVCNKGPEILQRYPLRWPDIAHLVLFNLSIIHGKKFFDFDTTIMNFLKDKWSQLQVKGEELSRSSLDEKRQKMVETLQSNKSRFKSAREMKLKSTIWGLINRVPPPVPVMVLPTSLSLPPKSSESPQSPIPPVKKIKNSVNKTSVQTIVKRNRRSPPLPPPPPIIRDKPLIPKVKPLISKEKIEISSQDSAIQNDIELKTEITRKWQRRRRRRLKPNSLRSASQNFNLRSVSEISDSEDTSSSHGTLNSIIPHPNNFDGPNNPFTSYDRSPSSTSQTSSTTSSNRITRTMSRSKRKSRHRQNHQHTNLAHSTHSLINNFIKSDSKDSKPHFHISQPNNINGTPSCISELNSSMDNYFGAQERIANGEKFHILARRIRPTGEIQYLIEWEGLSS